MIKKIMVPTDGSAHADAAVDWASEIAKRFQARLVLIHVIAEGRVGRVSEDLRAYVEIEQRDAPAIEVVKALGHRINEMAEQRARLHGAQDVESTVEIGDPAKTILAEAKRRGIDLIVMGRRGLGTLPGMLLGSVSNKVIHLAECACLTVK